MICKYLEKKIEVQTENDISGGQNPIVLEYYLLECDSGEPYGDYENKTYGIEVVKKIKDDALECEIIKDFSPCKASAREILDKLAKNTVTPVELKYILDDLLGS